MSVGKSTTRQVEYRDIPGFPGYRIGSDGSVWSKRRKNHPLPDVPWRRLCRHYERNKCGQTYETVDLWLDGKPLRRKVHRLLMAAFVGPCPDDMEVCHNDGNGLNCSLDNLRYDTRKGNVADTLRHGTRVIGEQVKGAKLTSDQVRKIRDQHKGGATLTELARIYSVSIVTMHQVLHRKTWSHVV